MVDPNSCATCDHKRADTGSAWCYMFREQPEPLCMQHQDRRPKRVGIIGHVGPGKATLTAAIAGILMREASKTAETPDGATGAPAHSKSEYKRRDALGDPNVLPPAGVSVGLIPPDAITVNLVRFAGLDKHKARECEAIVRQVLAAHGVTPSRYTTACTKDPDGS